MSAACSRPDEEAAEHDEGEWCEMIRLKAGQRRLDQSQKGGGTSFFSLLVREVTPCSRVQEWLFAGGGEEMGHLISGLGVCDGEDLDRGIGEVF